MEIIGKKFQTKFIETGMHSFDRAFNFKGLPLGFPVNIGIEIYGQSGTGKTTLALALASMIAGKHTGRLVTYTVDGEIETSDPQIIDLEQNIGFCDFEQIEINFLVANLTAGKFDNAVIFAEGETDEQMLDHLIRLAKNDEINVSLVDSIGAVSPISEQEGEIGEANMGRRARIMAQFTRKWLKLYRNPDIYTTVILINHWYPNVGGYGYTTPGGQVKNYLAHLQIKLKKKLFANGSYQINGEVTKNKQGGGEGSTFQVIVKKGEGVHKGLTALFDAKELKLVTVYKGNLKVKDTKEDLGSVEDFFEHSDDEERFEVFYELLGGAE